MDVSTFLRGLWGGRPKKSIKKGAGEGAFLILKIKIWRYTPHDRHKTVDDKPFGGGPGMLLKPEPLFQAIESLHHADTQVILLTPQGKTLEQSIVRDLATRTHLILICGHYEGVDERVREHLVDTEISI